VIRRLFPNVYEGWVVVGSFALLVVMIGTAFFYGFGTIFKPVIEEFGWTNAEVSLAFSLRSEVGGIAAPLIGIMIDRFGPRKSLLSGVVVASLGVFGLAYMQNLWHFYIGMFVIALGVSACGGPVGMVATATWFERRRARALSYLTVGGAVAGLGVPVVAWLVESFGWRDGLRYLSVAILVVGLFSSANVRSRPADHPQPIDGDGLGADGEVKRAAVLWGVPTREVMRSRAFILLSLSQAAVGFGTTALIVHVIPYLEYNGVSKTAAATAVTIYTLFSLVGRLGLGYLADTRDKRLIMAFACLLVALGMPLLAFTTALLPTMLVLLLIAPGFGGTIPVRPAMLADYFGTRYFGAVNGAMIFVQTLGAFFGPWLVGWLVDVTGNYALGWYACGAVTALAVPLTLLAMPPRQLIARYAPSVTAESR